MPGIAGMQSRVGDDMTESTQRDPIDFQVPVHSFKTISKIMIDRPIVSAQFAASLPRDGTLAGPLFARVSTQSKKYAVIEVKLGTFVTRDSLRKKVP